MDNKNLHLNLAKSYIAHFYESISPSFDKKQLKDIRSKVDKYEDTSYLKDIRNEEIDNIFRQEIENKQQNTAIFEELKKDLDDFYNEYFEGKEIIDVKAIKAAINPLDIKIQKVNDNLYLADINPLYEFKNNLNVELEVYIHHHKAEEYMDMSIFHQNIKNIINEVKNCLTAIEEGNKLDKQEYLDKYYEAVNNNYSIIFDNKKGGITRIPKPVQGLLFCSPWILGFLVFTMYPLVQTLIFSFSSVDLSTSGFNATPIGFANYVHLFTNDTDFILALKNYAVEMIVYVPLITIFSLMLAMLLNTNIRGKSFFRTIFFFPVVITSGPVIKILIEQGVTAMPGLNSLFDIETVAAQMPELVRIAFNLLTSDFVMILWFSGIQILVFLTALQKIDKGVYEASAIDGASKWEQFWKVTLPALNPTIVINVVFTVVMQSIFALNPIILKIQSDMNDTSEGKGYGYSSALAFTYFLVMIIVLLIFVFIFKKHERKGNKAR